ncbi:hypothetical protein ACFWSJ_26030 [Streptomyces niveus]|uniref:hypothetical protein n=1 Tax=Streptomyces niveus TaxID=193462 RepID=UPI0036566AD8
MDQGLAALYGAGIGAVFGGGTAIAAAWLGRGGMRMQAEAAIRQADRQADAQREQWKLTMRRDATVAFLMAAHDFLHAALALWEAISKEGATALADAELTGNFKSTHRSLHRTAVTVYLESTPELAPKIADILELADATRRVSLGRFEPTDSDAAERELYRRRRAIGDLESSVAVFPDHARPHLSALGISSWNPFPTS